MCKVGALGPLLMWIKENNQEVLKMALIKVAIRRDENQFATIDTYNEVWSCKALFARLQKTYKEINSCQPFYSWTSKIWITQLVYLDYILVLKPIIIINKNYSILDV